MKKSGGFRAGDFQERTRTALEIRNRQLDLEVMCAERQQHDERGRMQGYL
jgi:hypothetical protein